MITISARVGRNDRSRNIITVYHANSFKPDRMTGLMLNKRGRLHECFKMSLPVCTRVSVNVLPQC